MRMRSPVHASIMSHASGPARPADGVGERVGESQQFDRYGKISVEFRSAATSTIVDSMRSFIAPGLADNSSAARRSDADASSSPIAWMTLARRSRSASAWRPIARRMPSGNSTSLTSTLVTLTPQGLVRSSMICCSRWLISSRLTEEVVELDLAEDAAQGGLRDLRCGVLVVLNRDDRTYGVDHVEVGHRVHPQRDVVLCDHVLGRDIGGDRLQVDLHHAVDERDDEEQAGTLRADDATEAEDDAPFVFGDDADRGDQHDDAIRSRPLSR